MEWKPNVLYSYFFTEKPAQKNGTIFQLVVIILEITEMRIT